MTTPSYFTAYMWDIELEYEAPYAMPFQVMTMYTGEQAAQDHFEPDDPESNVTKVLVIEATPEVLSALEGIVEVKDLGERDIFEEMNLVPIANDEDGIDLADIFGQLKPKH